jgi:hypothetical protein
VPKRGRPSKGRTEALFTLAVSNAELEELHRRAREAGAKNTSDWARAKLLEGFDPSTSSSEPREIG